ncbi:hypothetical protein GALMADRAFT_1321639 [Galerina marginata CBS 339.88]|uniref:Uncharacterized protein n=1 Tax=Galerina marginata (strain CBS 339.88) TaxID=685588 RepID=A0A067TXR4_GALM3|nr:hypothetical protein GALMADRAFT_1321639 [Galerina marginata CBS 339.88]
MPESAVDQEFVLISDSEEEVYEGSDNDTASKRVKVTARPLKRKLANENKKKAYDHSYFACSRKASRVGGHTLKKDKLTHSCSKAAAARKPEHNGAEEATTLVSAGPKDMIVEQSVRDLVRSILQCSIVRDKIQLDTEREQSRRAQLELETAQVHAGTEKARAEADVEIAQVALERAQIELELQRLQVAQNPPAAIQTYYEDAPYQNSAYQYQY